MLIDQDLRFERVEPPLHTGATIALLDGVQVDGERRPLLSSAHLAGYVLLTRLPSNETIGHDGHGNLARLEAPRHASWRQVAEALLRLWATTPHTPATTPHRLGADWQGLRVAIGSLTPREHEVLRLIASGLSVPEMARRLHLADSTVENHRTRLMSKLGVNKSVDAARIAYRTGLVAP
ncbi:helix-turn-helix transcriptional regulator [Posidoniimonas polymericola]|uniref:helix-turn-helix transcriptional regulator n=1 Tax=Posidoniimonas polymericola TaxID=2528002 RepID=UPI001E2BC8AB|nr:LuxR C-terminal-related transcriptional regulator [Posidoniimonas polymericola]